MMVVTEEEWWENPDKARPALFHRRHQMNKHPSYQVLSPYLLKYPKSAGCLFQAYNDIVYAQQWKDVELIEVEACKRAVINGKKGGSESVSFVVPCSLAEIISFEWLMDVFTALPSTEEIFLAITSEDASIVYYKISKDIIKPQL
ncbi:hypothetical protein AX16_004567 [Volvariella volvacea WC 439]|nr:hypothetical protein AX16_004567 [Volvariella volvacea WC 439]